MIAGFDVFPAVDPQSPRYEALLRALFSQSLNPAKAFSYDIYAEHADYASLNSIVRDHIIALLRTHGAIETDPPLLVPVTDLYSAESSQQQPPTFLDRQGELVALPKNIVVPLARFAARAGLRRIKRYYVGHAYEPTAGQPKAWAQAALDIISPDTADCAAEAELIGVTNDVICMFPGVSSQPYDIHISDTRRESVGLIPKRALVNSLSQF
jgi:translation initiation factor 2-alpha kinase 4